MIAGLQARNNARVVLSGSLSFFSDEYFTAQIQKAQEQKAVTSGNRNVAIAISQWVFKDMGQLRVRKVNHHKEGEQNPPEAYTVMENVVSIR